MNRRQFLGTVIALPLSEQALAKPTEYQPCTCGDFEPGPMSDTNMAVQCENCRGWVNVDRRLRA